MHFGLERKPTHRYTKNDEQPKTFEHPVYHQPVRPPGFQRYFEQALKFYLHN